MSQQGTTPVHTYTSKSTQVHSKQVHKYTRRLHRYTTRELYCTWQSSWQPERVYQKGGGNAMLHTYIPPHNENNPCQQDARFSLLCYLKVVGECIVSACMVGKRSGWWEKGDYGGLICEMGKRNREKVVLFMSTFSCLVVCLFLCFVHPPPPISPAPTALTGHLRNRH